MTPKDKAIQLISKFKLILMDEDTECGNEILCTIIAERCAKVVVDEIFEFMQMDDEHSGTVHFANSKWTNFYTQVNEQI